MNDIKVQEIFTVINGTSKKIVNDLFSLIQLKTTQKINQYLIVNIQLDAIE